MSKTDIEKIKEEFFDAFIKREVSADGINHLFLDDTKDGGLAWQWFERILEEYADARYQEGFREGCDAPVKALEVISKLLWMKTLRT